MAIEIELPKEIGLKIKSDKSLEGVMKKKTKMEISKELKKDVFLLMLFDKLFEKSELTERLMRLIIR